MIEGNWKYVMVHNLSRKNERDSILEIGISSVWSKWFWECGREVCTTLNLRTEGRETEDGFVEVKEVDREEYTGPKSLLLTLWIKKRFRIFSTYGPRHICTRVNEVWFKKSTHNNLCTISTLVPLDTVSSNRDPSGPSEHQYKVKICQTRSL